MLFASSDCSCRCLSSSKGVGHELFQRFCSKTTCLLVRCSALVCVLHKQARESLFEFFAWNISWSVLTGWSFSETSIVGVGHFSFWNVCKELRLWSLFSFTFYAQCFLGAAVGAMNIPKAVSLATSAVGRYGVQTEVNRTSNSTLIITSILST